MYTDKEDTKVEQRVLVYLLILYVNMVYLL